MSKKKAVRVQRGAGAKKSKINDAKNGIVFVGNPVLRQKARLVKNIKAAQPLIRAMVKKLRAIQGAGLAAPQIGKSLRLFVVEVRRNDLFPHRSESGLFVVINPRIVRRSGTAQRGWEACFSIPGYIGEVLRHETITLEYTDAVGTKVTKKFSGYLARVMQHEYDHIEGHVYVDRMTDMHTFSTVENWGMFHLDA